MTGVSRPRGATENTDTGSSPSLAVSSSRPPALNPTDAGELPVANGEPLTGVYNGAATALAALTGGSAATNPASAAGVMTPARSSVTINQ